MLDKIILLFSFISLGSLQAQTSECFQNEVGKKVKVAIKKCNFQIDDYKLICKRPGYCNGIRITCEHNSWMEINFKPSFFLTKSIYQNKELQIKKILKSRVESVIIYQLPKKE